jgi:hypothetical protein
VRPLAPLLLLCACPPAPDTLVVPRLEVADAIDAGDATLDAPTVIAIELRNLGLGVADVAVSTSGSVTAPARLTVAPGAAARVALAVAPTSTADVAATVWFDTGVERRAVDVAWVVDDDADDDGRPTPLAGGDDCDDRDPSIFPGAPERCDGADEDCDDAVDEDPIDAPTWHRDQDHDGAGDPDVTATACARPAGFVADASDCDDTDAAVRPGAHERYYDGVDQDCDGASDDDADADGYDSAGHGGEDCRDSDPTSFPGAPERPGDGLDQDCDGAADERAPTAGELVVTEVLAVGASGPAYVELTSTSSATLDLATWSVDGAPVATSQANLAPFGRIWACFEGAVPCPATLPSTPDVAQLEVRVGGSVDVVPVGQLPGAVGVAAELAGPPDVDSNDDPAAWCASAGFTAWGDSGTPGGAAECP